MFWNNNEASNAAEAVFSQAAKENKGKVLFSITKLDDGFELYERLAEFVGANVEKAPVLVLVKVTEELAKYEFTASEITVETLTAFVDDYINGKLNPTLKSEKEPETNDAPVKVVVGTTFEEMVLNTTADVLVEFYAPWCGHCKSLEPIYNKVAEKLLVNKNIVLVKIDATANDIPNANI